MHTCIYTNTKKVNNNKAYKEPIKNGRKGWKEFIEKDGRSSFER